MSTFSTYGHVFTVPDRFAEGHPLTANQATALNGLMAEMISHRVRSGPLDPLSKGDTPTPEQVAEAETLIASLAETFEFGAGRGPGAVQLNPVDKEAREIARKEVRAAVAKAGKKISKKDAPVEDGEYPFTSYEAKVAEVMQMPEVQKAAKAAVAARSKGTSELGFSI